MATPSVVTVFAGDCYLGGLPWGNVLDCVGKQVVEDLVQLGGAVNLTQASVLDLGTLLLDLAVQESDGSNLDECCNIRSGFYSEYSIGDWPA